MTMSVGAELAAVLATVLAFVGSWPQLHRIALTGDMEGVSPSCAALGLVTEMGWIVYAIRADMWSAVPEACLMAVSNVGLLVLLLLAGAVLRGSAAVALGWAVLLGGALLAGQDSAAVLLALAYVGEAAPAVWCAYRSPAPTGIARLTWVLIGMEATLWGVYGASHRDPANLTFGLIGSSAAIAILLRTRRSSSTGVAEATRVAEHSGDTSWPWVQPGGRLAKWRSISAVSCVGRSPSGRGFRTASGVRRDRKRHRDRSARRGTKVPRDILGE